MRVSFVIVTDGSADDRIENILTSIENQNIPEYEVVIVGGAMTTIGPARAQHVEFDESQRTGWITRKKNIGTQSTQYEVIVYLHDYHVFDVGWYQALVNYGNAWDIQMNAIQLITGRRTFDWLIYDHPILSPHTLVPYGCSHLIKNQYISGGYWVAKRHVMVAEPLNENLLHHQAEDLEWSKRVKDRYRIVMNPGAIVRHNKVHREVAMQNERDAIRDRHAEYFQFH